MIETHKPLRMSMNTNMDYYMVKLLDEYARINGMSRAMFIREAVRFYITYLILRRGVISKEEEEILSYFKEQRMKELTDPVYVSKCKKSVKKYIDPTDHIKKLLLKDETKDTSQATS